MYDQHRDDQPECPGSTESSQAMWIHSELTQASDGDEVHQSIDEAELTRVATAISDMVVPQPTRQNSLMLQQTLTSVKPNDPLIDPSNPSFNFLLWIRQFMKLLEREGHCPRKSGFCFKDLNVFGTGASLKTQTTVMPNFAALFRPRKLVEHQHKKHILRALNGSIQSGEMLIVLGRPGAGCSTFLKSICGELGGLRLDDSAKITYDGVPREPFLKEFKGEVVYNQETEKHFPHLTVGQTLEFAAACRTPSNRLLNASRKQFAEHTTAVIMKVFGLTHTRNTKVGNDYVRGVSGGERKRVSIAEMALAGPSIAAWDNSSRGLDSATALEFVKYLRTCSDVSGITQAVAIYQASQSIYDLFDKALLLYEGRQIYFGPAEKAREYFERMGYQSTPRQTTADFLTAVTNPLERITREGFEILVPRMPDEFERYWQQSEEYKMCMQEIMDTDEKFGEGHQNLHSFRQTHREMQAKLTRNQSPYIISIPMQIKLCFRRAYQRIWNDKASTISTIGGQVAQALIVGSIFYGTADTTASFYSRGSALFFAILLSALQSIIEINGLYEQRPIVSKHRSYAFYHPWTEAAGGIMADIPIKLLATGCFLIILYFFAGLKAEAARFFVFFLFCFVAMLTMSMIFRTTAAATKSVSQAFAIAGVLVLWIAVYTGFAIQRSYMKPWFKWSSWINPVAYAYEALLVNEVHGRRIPCATSELIPPYGTGNNFGCAVPGAVPGKLTVSGDAWVLAAYGYSYSHIWRNLGFLFVFLGFFMALYLTATEMNSGTDATAEVLVFRRGKLPKYMQDGTRSDAESASASNAKDVVLASVHDDKDEDLEGVVIATQKDIFTWRNITLDIKLKNETRRLLDGVSGWIKPGSLTALMGTSGAGKTTLLDALSRRISIGVIRGDMLVNGKSLDASFQRKIGYVQQQDLHLETTTVREALRFSALLRQPKSTSKKEKFEYVEQMIKLLRMEGFAEAVVGVPGEGLNVEQRKLLSIGVEMVAKPALLLFLDEPTSGLDSQSSWSIVSMLRRLADNGQAILCTIHQPSALLFQQFDRLLFLAKGGKTVYFGDIGEQSRTVLNYFERNGAPRCGDEENPAEYILEVVGQNEKHDWAVTWNGSPEFVEVKNELNRIHTEKKEEPVAEQALSGEFAMPLAWQVYYVTQRVFSQYWRTPKYIHGKFNLVIATSLFIGFTFYKQGSTKAGLQNALFAIFMLTAIFSALAQQIMPHFVIQRSLYEVRERPSKAYSWVAFIFANIVVEIPYQTFLAILAWAGWYYTVFGDNNSSEESGLMLLFVIEFMVFAATFAQMVIAALPDAETAGNIATLFFSLTLTFNGVLQTPDALPRFWIFMYRVSPLTYLIGGWAGTSLSDRIVRCAKNELAIFDPPSGQTCGEYLEKYFQMGATGNLYNPSASSSCEYCSLSTGAQFLAASRIYASEAWRNFGLLWAYIIFNIVATCFIYYIFRVKQFSFGRPAKSP
ncbi:MAG: GTPase-activating protein [Cirrosporium novae-zelandiae]|nr:MAG: GTPase-activating protein [Cirrosporium novae-zelandiae]